MPHYSARAIPLSTFGKYEMLAILAGFDTAAGTPTRQRTIDILVQLHGIGSANTLSLTYDPTFIEREGRNVKRTIRIGPSAFAKDYPWLANVVFHESIHSDQFDYYDRQGFIFGVGGSQAETERILVALDECEGFYWPWKSGRELGLSDDQQRELRREVELWLIEIGHEPSIALARRGEFDKARSDLISAIKAPGASRP